MARPNILFITCHDLGRFLGCYGIPTVRTPNLDSLASDGVLFRQAYCTAPQCSPARASIFTGRYPHCNGVMGLTHLEPWDFYPNEKHMAQVFKEGGYKTGLIGVYHESGSDPSERFGFDKVDISVRKAQEVTDKAIEAIKCLNSEGSPFFLEVGYTEPHRQTTGLPQDCDYLGFTGNYIEPDASLGVSVPPYLVDEETAHEEVAELQGAVAYLDAHVGRLISCLHEFGIERQTLVIFITDHGLPFPKAKCSLYDGGIEIAFIMRYPERGWTGGKVVDALLSQVDVLPTLMNVIGLDAHALPLQGVSFAPLLDGEPYEPRDCIFSEISYHQYYDPRRCIRTDRYKLIANFTKAPFFMESSQSWRPRTRTISPAHPANVFHPPLELYDLAVDPLETVNLIDSAEYSYVKQLLLGKLSDFLRQTHDPILEGFVASHFTAYVLKELGLQTRIF